MIAQPPPGSDEAIDAGCTCPVMDNSHGKGHEIEGEVAYWITEGCPLHTVPVMDALLKAVGV